MEPTSQPHSRPIRLVLIAFCSQSPHACGCCTLAPGCWSHRLGPAVGHPGVSKTQLEHCGHRDLSALKIHVIHRECVCYRARLADLVWLHHPAASLHAPYIFIGCLRRLSLFGCLLHAGPLPDMPQIQLTVTHLATVFVTLLAISLLVCQAGLFGAQVERLSPSVTQPS